jgi:hypothetical protein
MREIDLPTPDEILQRIRDCREELAALKKLLRTALAASQAKEARRRREASSQADVIHED